MLKLCEKLKIHYAWLVLFSCCCFFGASMGIYNNCAALYTADLLADMGWTMTLTTAVGVTLTLSRMATTRATSIVFKKVNIKLVLSLAVIAMMGACMAKALIRNVALYVVINILIGAAGGFLLYVPVPMLINSWFEEKKDTALGIAMLCSGLFAAVCSPIFTSIINARGWRYATVINGLVGLAIALPPILLFTVKTPGELGLMPYGHKEKEPEPMKVATSPSQVFDNGHPDYDTRFSRAEKKQRFALSALLALLVFGLSYMPSKLPHFATTSGLGSSIGALMFSASQFGNMASKALMGPLCDRFGPRRTYTSALFIVFLAYLSLCFMPVNHVLLLVIAFLTGISSGNNMMIYPAAVRTYSKGDEYTAYISRVSMYMTFFGTPWSFLLSILFDVSGSYHSTFWLFAVLEGVSVILCLMMFRKEEKS